MPRVQQSKNWTISQIDGHHPVHPKAFTTAIGVVLKTFERFDLLDHHLYIAIIPHGSITSDANPVPRMCVPMPHMGAIAVAGHHDGVEEDETFMVAFALSLMDATIQWIHQVLGHEDVLDPHQLDFERSRLMWDILDNLEDF